jgi:CheY-like chemotaxis protein
VAARVVGDEDRLIQVLVNLLSNAVKFSPEGAPVAIGVQEIPGWVEVTVQDHGRGVPAGFREVIFERFRQVEASDARRERGAGLGLSICKAIVARHGGQIGVRGEEGQGSTFWFRVPAFRSGGARAEGGKEGEVILVCASDGTLREAIEGVLRRAGHEVLATTGAARALESLRASRVALAVVESALPDGSALEFLDGLARDPGLGSIPVVLVGDPLLASPRKLPGNVAMLLPPQPDEQELVDAIRNSLAGRGGADVLLVDDDGPLLDVMARQLTREGVAVRTAATGSEAVSLARERPPALLVLDVGLPDLDGYDVVAALRGEARLSMIPVLVYTGRDLSGEQRRRLRLGPTRYITKSRVTDDAFRDLVLELLRAPEDRR